MVYTYSMIKKKIYISIILLLPIFALLTRASVGKADDLVIQDDGKVVLIITNSGVLGESTTVPKEPVKTAAPPQQQSVPPQHIEQKQQSSSSPSSNPAPQAPAKTVSLVPPHTESTVQINPSTSNDKKVQVTITTHAIVPQTPSSVVSIKAPVITAAVTTNTNGNMQHISQTVTNLPAKPFVTVTSSPTLKSQQTIATQTTTTANTLPSAVNPPSVLTKTVDQVVAQGSNGQPVITIKSDQAHQLTIQQGSTNVITSLPLQINTLTHSLSVSSQHQSATINVLPSEALQGILNNGLLNTQDVNQTKINLTKDTNGINYTVNTQKQGKLFGVFPVNSPVQIKLSAQNGKIVTVAQSVVFSIFGGFIK